VVQEQVSFCVFSHRSLSFFCFRHRVSGKHEARLTLSLMLSPRSGASVSQARYRYTTFDTVGELVGQELGDLLGSESSEVRYSRFLCFSSCYEVI
jgi:hypothetical protein